VLIAAALTWQVTVCRNLDEQKMPWLAAYTFSATVFCWISLEDNREDY